MMPDEYIYAVLIGTVYRYICEKCDAARLMTMTTSAYGGGCGRPPPIPCRSHMTIYII